jgi:tetratricopeptide (TPR) repeat protein
MLSCRHRGVVVLAVSIVLATAGCSSSRPFTAAATQSQSSAASDAPPKSSADTKEVDDRRVLAHAHYAQAMIYDMDDEPDMALKEFSAAATEDPSNEELVLELTRRYLLLKQPEEALQVLNKAVAAPDASGELYARLGMVYSRMGKPDQAIEAAQTAIKRSPQSLSGYEDLFVIHLQNGKPRDALKVLDQAAKTPNVDAEFLINLGEFYANLQRQAPILKKDIITNGVVVLKQAARLNPSNPRLKLKLADEFSMFDDTTDAAGVYVQLLDAYDDMPSLRADVRARLAEIYLRNHESAKAVEQLEAVVRDDPANSQAYYLLGSLAYDDKKLPEAIDYFQKTLLLSDDFEQAYYDLAGAQINFDKPMEALATLDRARAKFTGSFMIEFLSGLAYGKEKDYTNALAHFTAAEVTGRTSEPERLNRYFYFEAGAAYERTGNFDEAQKYFQKSLELSPDFAEALNYLGYMWADRGVKLDDARQMIEKAVKLEPKSAAYLDSLGWVLYRLNKPQEALSEEEKAIELSPEPDATLYDHLGDIYAALKLPDKAREAWRKSLAIEPNEQIQKKLDQAANKTASKL